MNATTGVPFAAAAAASQSKPSHQRKHDVAAADSDQLLKPAIKSEIGTITEEAFKVMLDKPYSQKNIKGVLISGENKHNHSLKWDSGFVFCKACNKHLARFEVNRHIIGTRHRERVAFCDADSVKGGDSVASDDTSVLSVQDHDSILQDAVDGGKKSIKGKTPKETADSEGDGDGQIALALPVQDGSLVTNGFDVVKYIRWLEGRISELERKVAANATPSTENDTVA